MAWSYNRPRCDVLLPCSLFHSSEENNGAAGRTFNSITLTYTIKFGRDLENLMQFLAVDIGDTCFSSVILALLWFILSRMQGLPAQLKLVGEVLRTNLTLCDWSWLTHCVGTENTWNERQELLYLWSNQKRGHPREQSDSFNEVLRDLIKTRAL